MSETDTQKTIGLADFDADKNQNLDLWFNDSPEIAHGCRIGIKIKDVLCHFRSAFQEIAVFDTERLGRMLVLDGITMLTEFDEFAYHEMIAHVPLAVHPAPQNVLVIGGGDGGTAREVLKHPDVKRVDVCEIDEDVIKVCRRYLPTLASSFDDDRVRVLFEDGARYVQEHPRCYDVIIVDSTDPVGPGQVLFQRKFYEDMKSALRDGGIAVTQCESMYFHKDVIRGVYSSVRSIYAKMGLLLHPCPHLPQRHHWFLFLLPGTRSRQRHPAATGGKA